MDELSTKPGRRLGRRDFLRFVGVAGGVVAAGQLLIACGGAAPAASSASAATSAAPASAAPASAAAAFSSTAASPASAAAASAAAKKTLADINVQLSWYKSVEFGGYYLADDGGVFAKEGLKVNLLAGGPNSPQPEQALAGGSADIATATGVSTVATAIKAGTDLVMIAAAYQRQMGALISLSTKPIKSLADLAGKRLGIYAVNSQDLFDNLMKANGLPPTIKYVKIGVDPAPLVEGQIDALLGFGNNQPLILEDLGLKPTVVWFDDLGLPGYTGHIIVKRSYLAAHRDLVVSYLRALATGFEMNLKDPAPAAKLTAEKYGPDLGLSFDNQKRANVIYIDAENSALTKQKGLMSFDPAFIAGPVYKGLALYGLTDLPDPNTYTDLTVLQDVYKGKTSLLS